jgi:HD-like signal output (HDOD) protein
VFGVSQNKPSNNDLSFKLSDVSFDTQSTSKDLRTAFYDLIFGEDNDETIELSAIEQQVCDQLQITLDTPKTLSSYIPALPKSMHQLMGILQEENTDFDSLAKVVSQDIKLTVEVIRVANNPLYRRTEHKLESLTQAIQIIGLDNVGLIATSVMMKNVLHVKPVYFKWFGELIWNHSLQCATACQYLSGNNNTFDAYLVGLMHDAGKIVIFKCLVDILSKTKTNELPNSKWFKRAMTEDSKCLSVILAKEWKLSDDIITALEQQETSPTSDLGKVLYLSNISSELELLIHDKKIDRGDSEDILKEYGLSENLIEHLFSIMRKAVEVS